MARRSWSCAGSQHHGQSDKYKDDSFFHGFFSLNRGERVGLLPRRPATGISSCRSYLPQIRISPLPHQPPASRSACRGGSPASRMRFCTDLMSYSTRCGSQILVIGIEYGIGRPWVPVTRLANRAGVQDGTFLQLITFAGPGTSMDISSVSAWYWKTAWKCECPTKHQGVSK